MGVTQKDLCELAEALEAAHIYVEMQLATGGKVGAESIPFDANATVLNEVRDHLNTTKFKQDQSGGANVQHLMNHGFQLTDADAEESGVLA